MGKMMTTMNTVVVAVVMVVLTVMSGGAEGQSSTPSCASNLVNCSSYLKSTSTPPAECCTPLKQAVDNDLQCLCAVLNDATVMNALNITTDEGFRLARSCGISSFSNCSNATSPSATPTPPGKNNGYRHGANWIGMSTFTSLFVFCWSIVA
ncbi:lipid transfer-like protein [Musa troglodytarum]|uniref:Lipid transfer-like protein n=1 Tax=Musa troglodytarum TaxID=320322 RepID=A0A9E7JHD2_9LILI|nr:lipid transfer-like protein [Musa troglodytarum]